MENQPPLKRKKQELARGLLESIRNAVQGHDLSNPEDLAVLPFPYLLAVPERFGVDEECRFQYMGRTGYQNFKDRVLSLNAVNNMAIGRRVGFNGANLWGTMGSGKSYMLAALACALLSEFSQASPQWQRVVYIPSAGGLLSDHVTVLKQALMLGYPDDAERLSEIRDKKAVSDFFNEQADIGNCIFLLIDDCNALEESQGDSDVEKQQKGAIEKFLKKLAFMHVSVKSASANNKTSMKWSRKQRNEAIVWHHGGLNEQEYQNFKKHFLQFKGSSSSLQKLLDKDKAENEDEELRIKDATGCVPLYLKCWTFHNDSPEDAWKRFTKMNEISTANDALPKKIREQLKDNIHGNAFLEMYIAFMTGTRTDAQPQDYDCRYLYVQEEDRCGKCACGIFRNMIAQAIQESQHRNGCVMEWQDAIEIELAKPSPNPSVLGFLLEQDTISYLLREGLTLSNNYRLKCDALKYFAPGREDALRIQEGCILYVPHAFNYKSVDCVIRSESGHTPYVAQQLGSIAENLLWLEYYKMSRIVIGIQITYGNLKKHASSEKEFCSPERFQIWCKDWSLDTVAKYFVWFARKIEIDGLKLEGTQRVLYGKQEVASKRRSSKIDTLEHATTYVALEDIHPILRHKRMKCIKLLG